MKYIYLLIIGLLITACASRTSHHTYVLHEGIITTLKFKSGDFLKLSEIRYFHKQAKKDLSHEMYKVYGKWDDSVSINRSKPLLIWDNIKLLSWSNEPYTIGVSGDNYKAKTYKINKKQQYHEINYNSFFILNSKGEDIILKHSAEKDSIINTIFNLMEFDRSII